MAEKKSSLSNDIQRTHYALLQQLIIGHVGNDTCTETYINWKTKFKDHCDDPKMLNYAVTANFQYLELKNIISPGKYDALRDIFSEDPEALSKINKAAEEIQRMESAAQFSDIKTKDDLKTDEELSVSHHVIPFSDDLKTDKELTVHVKSQDLKRLFCSFKILDMEPEMKWSLPLYMEPEMKWSLPLYMEPEVEWPLSLYSLRFPVFNDNLQPSFARRLLSALQCNDIVYNINKLSKIVFVLQKKLSNQADFWTSESIPVFEVEVVCTQGTLKVNEKDAAKKDAFFRPTSENLVKVIWINSKSVNVVDAKFTVFMNYEPYLKEQTIYIHHALENSENIIKFHALRQVTLLGTIIEPIADIIPIYDLEPILQAAIDKALSRESIRTFCYGIFLNDTNILVGTTENPSFSCHSVFTVRKLKEQLVHKTLLKTVEPLVSEIGSRIVKHIESKIKTKSRQRVSNLIFKIPNELVGTITGVVVTDVVSGFFPTVGIINSLVTFVVTSVLSVDVNSIIWRRQVADEIHDTIEKNKAAILRKIIPEVEEICLQNVRELKAVSEEVNCFKRCLGLAEQDALVNEWKKKDILKNKGILNTHPSVQTYLAGTRDGVHVVKVFLSGNDKKDAEVNLRATFPDVPFVFVDVDIESKTMLANITNIREKEQRAPPIDKRTREKMNEVIQHNAEAVFANHSSIIGIEISNVRSKNNVIVNELSIVLLCLDEFILPFGESPLPASLGGYPCDVRREFVMFGHCDDCQTLNIGCSIGIPSVKSAGSVGFFVRSNDSQGFPKYGFLTAAHVAIKQCDELYEGSSLLSKHSLAKKSHEIIHPSPVDNAINIVVGEVIESFIGNFGSHGIGIDAAFVETKQEVGDNLPLQEADENNLEYDGSMSVTKRGRTTGDTTGKLVGDCMYVRVYSTQVPVGYYEFQNCFAVEQTDNSQRFFEKGDSGSGVSVIDDNDRSLKPLGIAFAFYCSKTAVCKIGQITNAFKVAVYDNEQLMDTS